MEFSKATQLVLGIQAAARQLGAAASELGKDLPDDDGNDLVETLEVLASYGDTADEILTEADAALAGLTAGNGCDGEDPDDDDDPDDDGDDHCEHCGRS